MCTVRSIKGHKVLPGLKPKFRSLVRKKAENDRRQTDTPSEIKLTFKRENGLAERGIFKFPASRSNRHFPENRTGSVSCARAHALQLCMQARGGVGMHVVLLALNLETDETVDGCG